MHQRLKKQSASIERRMKARELAFQALFQYDVCGDQQKEILDFFLRGETDDELTRSLAREWTFGVIENIQRCDELLTSVMERWSTSALMPVERAILRLSVYHLMDCENIPGKVTINEAIELAKKFSTANSPGFVNGILDAVLKKIKNTNAEVSQIRPQPEIVAVENNDKEI